jgi:hypothetical protein
MSHVPDVDDIYDLGSATKQWKDLYVDGTAYVDAISNEGAYVGYVLDGYGAMLLNTYSDTDGHRYLFKFQKSHQDTIGNAATVDGDDYGDIQWMGNTGSGFVAAASIRAEQDGAAGASYLPGRIYIYTATAAAASTLKMAISSDGHVNITGCDYAGYCLQLFNDGNNANRKGLSIRCGADDAAGTNEAVGFYDGDGTAVGTITFTDATVSYNAFTGSHYAKIINEIEYGMLVGSTSRLPGRGCRLFMNVRQLKRKRTKQLSAFTLVSFPKRKA